MELLHVLTLFALTIASTSALSMPTRESRQDTSASRGRKQCTIKPLGRGQDDGPQILTTLKPSNVCSHDSVINMPGFYVVDTVLNITLNNVLLNLTGVIQYTPNIAYWSPNSIYLTYQNATTFFVVQGENITIDGSGSGMIHGNGQVWWDYFASSANSGVAGGSSRTFSRPIPLTIANARNVLVKDLAFCASPFWHNFVYQSTNVTYDNIFINSTSFNESAKASNSDGWDIYRSSFVTVQNSEVHNGDDCVSFKPNSTDITVRNMYCKGSHGVSVGSLGQYANETDIVSNVFVKNITMIDAENGARIKVFGGSNDPASISGGGAGYVKNITYEDFHVEDVDNPILLTQCYDTSANQCQQFPSNLSISDIHYINVTGTSSGAVSNGTVATLECSSPCVNITAQGTNLKPPNGTATYLCSHLVDNGTGLDFPCIEK